MPEAFDVELPCFYFDAMRAFGWLRFDWLSVSVPSAACVGDFGKRLTLKALGPLAARFPPERLPTRKRRLLAPPQSRRRRRCAPPP